MQEEHLAGVGEQRRDVARAERLARAEADDQRAVCPATTIRGRGGGEDGNPVGPAHAQQRRADRVDQARRPRREGLVDQVGHDLGVGVAGEADAARLELAAQSDMVLDDAVVDDRDVARDVRVGVGFAGAAVGGPARVPDAGVTREGLLFQGRFEVGQLADGAHDLDAAAAPRPPACRVPAGLHGEAGES